MRNRVSTGDEAPQRNAVQSGMGPMQEGDRCAQLSRKIRSQATQLADLTERLKQQEAYSRLVETRLLEIDPKHSLPVIPSHLHHANGGVSECWWGPGVGHLQDKTGPSHNEHESAQKAHIAGQRLKEAASLIRELREALANRDADANAAVERARTLQRDAIGLRRKLRETTAPTAANNAPGNKPAVVTGDKHNSAREHANLRLELQRQRESCAVAQARAERLQAVLESGARTKESDSTEIDLAKARSTIDSLRAEIARMRLKPLPSDGALRRACHASQANCIARGGCKRCQKDVSGPGRHCATTANETDDAEVQELEAEREALLDYVQDLLGKIQALETTCAEFESDSVEKARLVDAVKRELQEASVAAAASKRVSQEQERKTSEALGDFSRLQEQKNVDDAEKEEMKKMYEELLRQLKCAEEHKEDLQARARRATEREEVEREAVKALREELDQCVRRLADAESAAADRIRRVEEETLARETALSAANTRLSELDALQAVALHRAKELQECQAQSQALKMEVSASTPRLAKLETLERNVIAVREELDGCEKKKLTCEAHLRNERVRTQHLVEALREMEERAAINVSREKDAVSRTTSLEHSLREKDYKVGELSYLCDELQRRVASLQSGEELEGVRQQLADTFVLAERQDVLLEDAARKLEGHRDECRKVRGWCDTTAFVELAQAHDDRELREHLLSAEELLMSVRGILEPAVRTAWRRMQTQHRHDIARKSHLCDAHPKAGDESDNHRWRSKNEDPRAIEASLEDLAHEAAEALSQLTLAAEDYVNADPAAGEWRGLPAPLASPYDHTEVAAHDVETSRYSKITDLVAASRAGVSCESVRVDPPRADVMVDRMPREPRCRGRHGAQGPPSIAPSRREGRNGVVAWEAEDLDGCMSSERVARERFFSDAGGDGIRNASIGKSGAGARTLENNPLTLSRNRSFPSDRTKAAARRVAMQDHESLRRMETIRRSNAEVTRGVKSKRRARLQRGGRSGTTSKDSRWTHFSSGAQSPGTEKIRQRIREAQATLRSLRNAQD